MRTARIFLSFIIIVDEYTHLLYNYKVEKPSVPVSAFILVTPIILHNSTVSASDLLEMKAVPFVISVTTRMYTYVGHSSTEAKPALKLRTMAGTDPVWVDEVASHQP